MNEPSIPETVAILTGAWVSSDPAALALSGGTLVPPAEDLPWLEQFRTAADVSAANYTGRPGPREQVPAGYRLVPTGRVQRCCPSHVIAACCDPDDCGPCCPDCPTCPNLRGVR